MVLPENDYCYDPGDLDLLGNPKSQTDDIFDENSFKFSIILGHQTFYSNFTHMLYPIFGLIFFISMHLVVFIGLPLYWASTGYFAYYLCYYKLLPYFYDVKSYFTEELTATFFIENQSLLDLTSNDSSILPNVTFTSTCLGWSIFFLWVIHQWYFFWLLMRILSSFWSVLFFQDCSDVINIFQCPGLHDYSGTDLVTKKWSLPLQPQIKNEKQNENYHNIDTNQEYTGKYDSSECSSDDREFIPLSVNIAPHEIQFDSLTPQQSPTSNSLSRRSPSSSSLSDQSLQSDEEYNQNKKNVFFKPFFDSKSPLFRMISPAGDWLDDPQSSINSHVYFDENTVYPGLINFDPLIDSSSPDIHINTTTHTSHNNHHSKPSTPRSLDSSSPHSSSSPPSPHSSLKSTLLSKIHENDEEQAQISTNTISSKELYRMCSRHDCHIIQPPRAHHCSLHHTCHLLFDHYCIALGTCISYRNRRSFLLLITLSLLCSCWFLILMKFCNLETIIASDITKGSLFIRLLHDYSIEDDLSLITDTFYLQEDLTYLLPYFQFSRFIAGIIPTNTLQLFIFCMFSIRDCFNVISIVCQFFSILFFFCFIWYVYIWLIRGCSTLEWLQSQYISPMWFPSSLSHIFADKTENPNLNNSQFNYINHSNYTNNIPFQRNVPIFPFLLYNCYQHTFTQNIVLFFHDWLQIDHFYHANLSIFSIIILLLFPSTLFSFFFSWILYITSSLDDFQTMIQLLTWRQKFGGHWSPLTSSAYKAMWKLRLWHLDPLSFNNDIN